MTSITYRIPQLPNNLKPATAQTKRWVVKIGSSLITNNGLGLDLIQLEQWCTQISGLITQGYEIVLVSSGAIAAGMAQLGWLKKPTELPQLQAAAAIGQSKLIQTYQDFFQKHHTITAQILLTHADIADRERYLNARNTLQTLLSLKTIPIINENDTVVIDEIRLGDNDTLAALVAQLIDADVLVILTDQNGLYAADPRKHNDAPFIEYAIAGDPLLLELAGGAGSNVGTGGMYTKITAANRARQAGVSTVIAWGKEEKVLYRLAQGERIGTHLLAQMPRLTARKQWLSNLLKVSGSIVIDDGAAIACLSGKSLLPIGTIAVQGEFLRGEAIAVYQQNGIKIGQGLVQYDSASVQKILKTPSAKIAEILNYSHGPELIHHDDWVAL